MAQYGWYALTTSSTPYTWSPTGNWGNGADWANLASTTFPPSTGTVPGSSDTVYIASANSAFAPGAPFPAPPYNVDITINTAIQPIAFLGLGKFQFFAAASLPIIDVTGTALSVTGSIVDHFTATFPNPINTQNFSGGGIIDLATSSSLTIGTTVDAAITLNFKDSSADRLVLDGVTGLSPTAVLGQITGFQAGNVIDLPNVARAGATPTSYSTLTGALTIMTGAVTDAVLFLPGFSSVSNFSLKGDGGSGLEIITCFAEGTRIGTPDGSVLVEALREGDLVTICDPDTALELALPVSWIGRRRVDLRTHRQPEQARPIRIRANACGDGLPERDLLVSPEHCLFLDGALVPARLLVNGTTIVPETGLPVVQYFHVELDRHAILLAEGLPAESYLDTGNRAAFENGGAVTALHPIFATDPTARSWSRDACAPLATKPEQVEPIWRRLADRAAALGQSTAQALPPAAEPDLWLEVDGKILRAAPTQPGQHLFALPAHLPMQSIRLRSTAMRPSDRAPWLDDRRVLGVSVERIVLHGPSDIAELALDHPALRSGWWPAERDAARLWRWTDGNAALPVPPGTRMIEIRIAGAAAPAREIARAA